MPASQDSEYSEPERLLVEFLSAHPDGDVGAFDGWAIDQVALQHDQKLTDDVRSLLRHVPRELLLAEEASDDELFRIASGDGRPLAGSLAVGRRIGRFVLKRFIAHGGMGQVWEAEDEDLRRSVALKLMLPGRIDERSLELFAREARAGGRLAHPNIVTTLAFGMDDGLSWIAQELIAGSRTLKDFLDDLRRQEKVPRSYYTQVAGLMEDVARGLQAAHAAGVVHRDVKPQNILIAKDGTPKLTDFGLARVLDDPFLSQSGSFVGTVAYMSPEQIAAHRSGIDHRTDVFSLGIVLYELLALRRPFEGDTIHQIAQRITVDDPVEPWRVRSQCPRELSAIAGRALEKDPNRRYATMGEFADDLRRHLDDQPILASPPGVVARTIKWCRRNPAVSSAGVVALIALVIVTVLSLANATNARLATQRAADVFALSTVKDLDDLIEQAGRLHPPHPDRIPLYEDWLRDARVLIEGRQVDPSRDLKARLSLADHRRKLGELRAKADLVGDGDATLAEYPALVAARAERTWRRRLAGREPWPDEASLGAEVDALPAASAELNGAAWFLVDPNSPVMGAEVRALLLVERALTLCPDDETGAVLDTLAWAQVRVGRYDDALASGEAALALLAGLEPSIAQLRLAVEHARGLDLDAELERLDQEILDLEIRVGARDFRDREDAWWHKQLCELVSRLEEFSDPERGLIGDTCAPPFGWGVERRLASARSLAERSVEGDAARRAWKDALAGVEASARYGGLRLAPQMGLLPLGVDPDSDLWEFAHLQSGAPPARDGAGRLVIDGDSCIVLVLIPGGTFRMGADPTPGADLHDPLAQTHETPVHPVELSPYFLGKFEVTQGQWRRMTGTNPSSYGPTRYVTGYAAHGRPWSSAQPVETVSWVDCVRDLARLDLTLPSEAQWERAARAELEHAFVYGPDLDSLRGAANIADEYAATHGAANWDTEPDFDDGHTAHARVGSFRANGYGLHDMIGNVAEWCLDGYITQAYLEEWPKDAVMSPAGDVTYRLIRGGHFKATRVDLRSSHRHGLTPDMRSYQVGVRAARPVNFEEDL